MIKMIICMMMMMMMVMFILDQTRGHLSTGVASCANCEVDNEE